MVRAADMTAGGLTEAQELTGIVKDLTAALRTKNSDLYSHLIHLLNNLGYKYGDDARVDRLFTDHQRQILAIMDRELERHGFGSVLDLLERMQRMELPWDSLDSWVDDHKPELMRRLLTYLKMGWYDRVEEELRWLEEAGVRWPELAIVKRSNEIEAEREQEDWADPDEQLPLDETNSLVDLQAFQKQLAQRFTGKAKVWHLPYDQRRFGWTVLAFRTATKDKILRSLADLQRTAPLDINIYDPETDDATASPHGRELLQRIMDEIDYEQWQEKNPLSSLLVLFYGPREQAADSVPQLYHVTWDSDVERTGLVPQNTLKSRGRIYLWRSLDDANHYARGSFQRRKDVPALIFAVTPAGQLFVDHEHPDAFYTKTTIPAQNLRLVSTVQPKTSRADAQLAETTVIPALFDRQISVGLIDHLLHTLVKDGYKYGDKPQIDDKMHEYIRQIQQWMERMLDLDIEEGIKAWKLVKDIDPPWDSMDSWWEDHKAEIVKTLLTIVRDGHMATAWQYSKLLMELGLKWPELRTIHRSAEVELDREEEQERAARELNESTAERQRSLINRVRQKLYSEVPGGNWWTIGKVIHDLQAALVPDRIIDDMLHEYKHDILVMENQLLQGDGGEIQAGLKNMLSLKHYAGVKWPELDEIMARAKPKIMRAALHEIAHTYNRAEYNGRDPELYDLLRQLRVTWPELDVIAKSLRASYPTLTEGVDLRQYAKQDGGTVFIRIPVDEVWHTDGTGLWTQVAKPVRVIDVKQDMEPTGDSSGWISDLGVYFDTKTWDTDRDGLIYTDPQFLRDLKAFLSRLGIPREIVDTIGYSEQGMQGDEWVSFDGNQFADYVVDQFVIGDAATIEQRKAEIVRQLLLMIKDGGTTRITALIKKLRELGADWPEFVAMERSIAAVRKKDVRETMSPEEREYAKELAAQLTASADSPEDCMGLFLSLVDFPKVVGPWAKQYFLPHRDLWIRFLLQAIKDGEHDTDEIYEAVRMLQRMRLPWPELDVIKRSMDSDWDQSQRTDEAYRDSPRMMAHKISTIKKLRELGANWPEFVAMEKSLAASRQTTTEARTDRREQDMEVLNSMYHNGPRFGVMPFLHGMESLIQRYSSDPNITETAKRTLEAHKHAVITYLLRLIKADHKDHAIGSVLRSLYDIGTDWPEIDIVKRSLAAARGKIREASDDQLKQLSDALDQHETETPQWRMNYPQMWYVHIWRVPEEQRDQTAALLDQHKETLVGDLLRMIRNNHDWLKLQQTLQSLDRGGVQWPELDIIKRSLRAGRMGVAEDEYDDEDAYADQQYDDYWLDHLYDATAELSHSLRNDDGLAAAEAMANVYELLYGADTDAPDFKSLILANKDTVIRGILQLTQQRGTEHSILAVLLLQEYYHMDWPELEVIARSHRMDSQRRRSMAEDGDEHKERVQQIRWLLQRATYALIDGDYRTAVMDISAMHQLSRLSDTTLDLPQEPLAGHKEGIMRALLTLMREGGYSTVRDVVDVMRDAWHVRWPDLDIILKSLPKRGSSLWERRDHIGALTTNVDEAEPHEEQDASSEIRTIVHKTEHRMLRLDPWAKHAIGDCIYELEQRLGLPDSDIAKALAPLANAMVPWTQRWLQHDRVAIIAQIFTLIEIGVRWPQLRQLVEDNKTLLVSSMLRDMSANEDTADAMLETEGHIKQLRALGIAWPELDIMDRSVQAELDREQMRERTDEASIYQRADSDLIDWFHLWMGRGRAYEALQILRALAERGLDLSTILEQHHDYLISFLLGAIKHGSDSDEVLDDIDTLRKLGVHWPEFRAMEQSLRAEQQRTRTYEAKLPSDGFNVNWSTAKYLLTGILGYPPQNPLQPLLQQHRDQVVDEIRKSFKRWEGKDFDLRHVSWLGVPEAFELDWPEMTDLAERYKPDIIRALLREIKYPNENIYNDPLAQVLYTINGLRRMGLQWPELDAIERSILAIRRDSR